MTPMRSPVLLALLVAACGGAPAQPAPAAAPPPENPASAGVRDARLADLLERHWEHELREHPVSATRRGDHRYDHLLADESAAARDADRRARRGFLVEAQTMPDGGMNDFDRETLMLLAWELSSGLESEMCLFETWRIGAGANPLVETATLPDDHKVKTRKDAENLLRRYAQIPRLVDDHLANLERGIAAGRFTDGETLRRVLAMFDAELAKPVRGWRLVDGALGSHGWPAAEEELFARELEAVVEARVKPAFHKYRQFLEERIKPHARGSERPGLAGLRIDRDCYRALIRRHTSLDRTPEELHELGKSELARINADMMLLGEKLFGTRDLDEILVRLRTDPKLSFATEAEIEEKAASAVAAAKAKMPAYFGVLPRADCVVRRIPEHQARFSTIAYYREPNADGSKPGEYFINVSEPTTRPRYEAEALAFHEAIPGHHLQIAITQELPGTPAFRRYADATAFVEGWALYAERLADEMGLYSGDLDRMGMLSYDAWRASRLVVDTGLHAFGWSRERAVEYMLRHTALAENNIRNEVDRYIAWPGQALAYKLGQLTIRGLRDEAEERLGGSFDLKELHDVILGGGGVTLEVLSARVRAWITKRAGALAPPR
jgi:uncharacterized protein (DUF885 family)